MDETRENGSTITVLKDRVIKRFGPDTMWRFGREVFAYTNLNDFTPALLELGPDYLVTERLTPIMELGKSGASETHCTGLLRLLHALHARGFAHCDIDLSNVVLHPVRGPLLIDWSAWEPARTRYSYDLDGADRAGLDPALLPAHQRPDGVWWNGPWPSCPGPYWNRYREVV